MNFGFPKVHTLKRYSNTYTHTTTQKLIEQLVAVAIFFFVDYCCCFRRRRRKVNITKNYCVAVVSAFRPQFSAKFCFLSSIAHTHTTQQYLLL